jgi:cytochrome c5
MSNWRGVWLFVVLMSTAVAHGNGQIDHSDGQKPHHVFTSAPVEAAVKLGEGMVNVKAPLRESFQTWLKQSLDLNANLLSIDQVFSWWPVAHASSETDVSKGVDSHADVSKKTKPKKQTMLDGRDIFVAHCMSCHLAKDQEAPQLADKEAWSWRLASSMDFLVKAVIAGKPYKEVDHPVSNQDRYHVDEVQTVHEIETENRIRGCELPRGGCKKCTDAQLIAAVKYMAQSASDNDSNYSLW